jgi:hypothetical protein
MLRKLIAIILGIAAVAPAAHSTGTDPGAVIFDNYENPNTGPGNVGGYGSPVSWSSNPTQAPLGQAGALVNATYNLTAHLYYAVGVVTDPSQITETFTSGGSSLFEPGVPGYFLGGDAITGNDYNGGPISFLVTVTGTYNGTPVFGESVPLTLSSISTIPFPPGYLDNLQSFSVAIVPEPGVLAMAALAGLAAWRIHQAWT